VSDRREALRRRERRPAPSPAGSGARLRRAAAPFAASPGLEQAQGAARMDALVDKVTERVIAVLRPELRRLESRLTRLVADIAMHHRSSQDA
jgi:hypothetical protein